MRLKEKITTKGTIDSEIMEKKSFIARLNKVSSLDGDYLVIYRAKWELQSIQLSHDEDLLSNRLMKIDDVNGDENGLSVGFQHTNNNGSSVHLLNRHYELASP
ncbi:hypothetical protein Tco_1524779 [Tanacetum coccineum]